MQQVAATWPVDAHVHFHVPDRAGPTLDAAAGNFASAGGGGQGVVRGAILLAQAARERVFEELVGRRSVAGWSLASARDEPGTILARKDGTCLAVVCGRQVRAADGLEVLALGTRAAFPDGLPFEQAIEKIQRSGALAVVPWGFGKWLGGRGRRMESAFGVQAPEDLFVGDNGSRVAALGMPSRLRALEARGFRVLPGTDPFPFGGDERRVGRFGFLSEAPFDEASPWRCLRAWLVARPCSPRPYGRACGPSRFVINQAGIQLYNRIRRSSRA